MNMVRLLNGQLSHFVNYYLYTAGIFLSIRGVTIGSNSYVNATDIGHNSDEALLCNTDKIRCCHPSNGSQAGDWYYPNGTRVGGRKENSGRPVSFARNRGPKVVRLYRKGSPSERGSFYCELLNAQNSNQTVHVNIGRFPNLHTIKHCTLSNTIWSTHVSLYSVDISAVTISRSGTTITTLGEIFTLECSVDITPNPLPKAVFSPYFEWFFGLNNTSLPSGVTVSDVTNSGNAYISTLLFFPLQESHEGMYTCRLGGNERLAANSMIMVNGKLSTSLVYYC